MLIGTENKQEKTIHCLTNAEDFDNTDFIETLEDIASLQPGKSAQLAAKKISEK